MRYTIGKKMLLGYLIIALLIVVIGVGATTGIIQIGQAANKGDLKLVNTLVHQHSLITPILAVIALIGTIAAGYILSKMIANPLKLISQNLGQVASGNLEASTISIKNRDEIGDLVRSFNEMKMN